MTLIVNGTRKNETIAGLANSVCGENVHFAGLRNLSSNKSVQK